VLAHKEKDTHTRNNRQEYNTIKKAQQ